LYVIETKNKKKQKKLCCECLCLIAVFRVSLAQLRSILLPSSFITGSPEDTQKHNRFPQKTIRSTTGFAADKIRRRMIARTKTGSKLHQQQ